LLKSVVTITLSQERFEKFLTKYQKN